MKRKNALTCGSKGSTANEKLQREAQTQVVVALQAMLVLYMSLLRLILHCSLCRERYQVFWRNIGNFVFRIDLLMNYHKLIIIDR